MSILVIDVGTSSIRAAVVNPDATIAHEVRRPFLADSPMAGLVEFDATALAQLSLDAAHEALAVPGVGSVEAVGIANQRASTIVWDADTGEPVAPGIGWQDLRTIGDCLVLATEGFRIAPNASATKLSHILDSVDPDRSRNLRFGTVDTWLIHTLTEGAHHVTDASNFAITALSQADGETLNTPLLERLRIPPATIGTVVDSSGIVGPATALPGAPPIAGIAGDQQASMVGQGAVRPGLGKATFGTGAMTDLCVGPTRPEFATRGEAGSFPIVAWRIDGETTWGTEAIMLSAGDEVNWLVDDLAIIDSVEASHELAASVDDTDGVVFVPAMLGLGTPDWDHGARGLLGGITRGTTAAHITRAVLTGIAERGADLVEAAELDGGVRLDTLRVDGGMSANPTFVQALADATNRPIEVSPVLEATALGAAFLAGLAVGTWSGLDEIAGAWKPASVVDPQPVTEDAFESRRSRWRKAVDASREWHPDLSAIDF